jgi:hypothetical protein
VLIKGSSEIKVIDDRLEEKTETPSEANTFECPTETALLLIAVGFCITMLPTVVEIALPVPLAISNPGPTSCLQ